MRDFFKAFMLVLKVLIRIGYMILKAAESQLQEMCILIKLIIMIERIWRPKNLLIISGKKMIISSLQTLKILWMLASLPLSHTSFSVKVQKLTLILMNHMACYPFLNIPNQVWDKKHNEEYNATSEDEKSRLQLNRRDRNFGIQPLNVTPK